MSYEPTQSAVIPPTDSSPPFYRHFIHPLLFLLTFFTAALAGVQWVGRDPFELTNIPFGLDYAFAILFVLASHEFGHYFAARIHGVKATLPYFIPFPPFIINPFGTFGALIRVKSVVPSRKIMFDIGAAGPIAGFVACLVVIVYGYATLPGPEYILSIHPNFDFAINADPTSEGQPLAFGSTLLFTALQDLLTNPKTQFVPPMTEIYHYPFLCVGWFGLFVTALNLMPIGMLDGGHITYSMFGEKHKIIARATFVGLVIIGLPSILDPLLRWAAESIIGHDPGQIIPFTEYSSFNWLLWALIGYYVIKLYHPPVPDESPLDALRMAIGWATLGIFVICFSLVPLTISI